MEAGATLGELRNRLAAQTGVPTLQQRLTLSGKILRGALTLWASHPEGGLIEEDNAGLGSLGLGEGSRLVLVHIKAPSESPLAANLKRFLGPHVRPADLPAIVKAVQSVMRMRLWRLVTVDGLQDLAKSVRAMNLEQLESYLERR